MLVVVDELQCAQSASASTLTRTCTCTPTAAALRRKLGISLCTHHLPVGLDDQQIEVYRVLRSITTEHLEPLHKLQGWDFIDAWFQCAEGASCGCALFD